MAISPSERYQITSQDYADLIIKYDFDLAALNASFPGAVVNIINLFYAVVHVPVAQITNNIIYEQGYTAMPLVYGLTSLSSLEASGVLRIRNIPQLNLRGQGVLIAIIDTGIDYTNPIFQYADGTTRIAYLWDQTIESESYPADRYYGTEYTREQINEALKSEDPFSIVPSRDDNGHGTMVAGIAGGSEVPDSNFYGVAPEAEFVIIKLKETKRYLKEFFKIPIDAVSFQENDILFAVEYATSCASRLQRPMAICTTLGSSLGSHDGRGILDGFLNYTASLLSFCVVIGVGNEGNARRHYYGTVERNIGFDVVELNVAEGESGFSMVLWGGSPNIFSIDILSPMGEYVPRISSSLDQNREISFVFESTRIYVDFQMVETLSGDQLILLRFSDPTPGIWKFNVYERGDFSVGFHIWLPMGEFISQDTYFVRSDPFVTVLSPGNAETPITVTAYNDADDSLYPNAGRGYSRIGRIKPEIAAPGVDVIGPDLKQAFTAFTGTSVSAAHTTGIVAMLLEWGIVKGNLSYMRTNDIKKLMIRGATRDPALEYPNQEWGYGILDVYNALNSLRIGV